jgi:hypothetical protein
LLKDIFARISNDEEAVILDRLNPKHKQRCRSRSAYAKREADNASLQAQCRSLMRIDEPQARCRLKTSVIAKMLGINQQRVRYLSTLHLREPAHSVPKSKLPDNIEHVAHAVRSIGLETLTVRTVQRFLASMEPPVSLGLSVVKTIMQNSLGLKFKQRRILNDRFFDDRFDDMRYNMSLLLGHLLLEDCLIVAIDESSFSHKIANSRLWQPGTKGIRLMDERALPLLENAAGAERATCTSSLRRLYQGQQSAVAPADSPPSGKPSLLLKKGQVRSKVRFDITESQQHRAAPKMHAESQSDEDISEESDSAVAEDLRCSDDEHEGASAASQDENLSDHASNPGGSSEHSDFQPPVWHQVSRGRKKRSTARHFRFSMTAAMTQDDVVGFQLVEGGSDAIVFENFLHSVLLELRKQEVPSGRRIVVFLDNARTHKTAAVQALA